MSVHFYYGAMNGGKSTLLLQTAHSYRSRDFEVIIVSHGINSRESGVTSRIGLHSESDIVVTPDSDFYLDLEKCYNSLTTKARVILVDEAQFLTSKQVEHLVKFSIEKTIDVQCYGLKTDFGTYLFEGSKRLIELSDYCSELEMSRCKCGSVARINARFNINTGEIITSGPSTLIEGEIDDIIYDPLCNSCFLKESGRFGCGE